jgi:amino acid transporter
VLQSFPSVLDYTTFAIVLATIADTTALYALRRRQPGRRRPYRAWGYPVVPALYVVANAGIALAMLGVARSNARSPWPSPQRPAVLSMVRALAGRVGNVH